MNLEGIDLVQNCQNTEPKRKKGFKWTDTEMITLVEACKKQRCLYDTTITRFADRVTKEIAILEMLNELKEKLKRPELQTFLTTDNIYKMCQKIKYTFFNEWKTVQRTKGRYKSKYVWYDLADSFLRPIVLNNIDRKNLREASKYGSKLPDPAKTYSSKRKASESEAASVINHKKASTYTYFDVGTQKDNTFAKFGNSVADHLRKMALPEALALFQEMQSLINIRRIALLQKDEIKGTATQEQILPYITSVQTVQTVQTDTEEGLVPNMVKKENVLPKTKVDVQPAPVLQIKLEDIMNKRTCYLRKKPT